jgi:hypothetical protein
MGKTSSRRMHWTMRQSSQEPALFLFAVTGPQAPTARKLSTLPTNAANDIKRSVVHFATRGGSVVFIHCGASRERQRQGYRRVFDEFTTAHAVLSAFCAAFADREGGACRQKDPERVRSSGVHVRCQPPRLGLRNEKELLVKSLDRLRQQHNVANRLTQDQREEQKRIEDAYDAPQEALNKIRHSLAKTRIFKPVKVEFMDGYALLAPVYSIDPAEKMTDAFLDSYLWYEGSRKGLFPNWVKPADTEPPPMLAYQFALAVSNSPHVWETAAGESTVMMQASIEDVHSRSTHPRVPVCVLPRPVLGPCVRPASAGA